MSSYFDNQYGGEDEDNKFAGDGSSSDSDESSSNSDIEEVNEIEDEVIGGEVEDIEDDIEEEEEEDEEDEEEEQSGGALDHELEEGENDEETDEAEKKTKKTKKIPAKTIYKKPEFSENEEEEDDDGEMYLQKFDQSLNENYIVNYHPESVLQNYDEILVMIKVVRDKNGIIIDDLHRTIPFLTKYEKARILGQRAKQINSGAIPFVKVPENVIDGYIIAELELKVKKIPFIIRRPLPNRGSEYWSIKDLEDISF
jgi:DNA-directed RNA polymerase I, II, and III subunit RPABC2